MYSIDTRQPRKEKTRASHKVPGERLKTVVRRLPPNLPEQIFWNSVQDWVSEETVTWKVYHQGKFKKRFNKENINSRAYIAFKDEEALATFSREYDGHLFRDKAGNESIAVVEFAPHQKVPSEKKKVDTRVGTIEKDEDYLSFLESLKESPSKAFDVDTLEQLASAERPPPAPTTTPLLEALKAEKSAQKDKESIIRAHAHYKDPAIAGGSSHKKDDGGKGKRGAGLPPKPSTANETTPQGKKATKPAPKGDTTPMPKKIAQNPNVNANANSASAQAATAKSAPAARPTPKSPRRNRDKDASKQEKTATQAAPRAQTPDTLAAPSNAAASSSTTAAPTAPGGAGGAPPSRRTRPIFGLASRHFEAALSGAGVERKAPPKREAGKDKDNKDKDAPADEGKAALTREAAVQGLAILTRPAGAPGTQESAGPGPGGSSDGAGRGRGRGRGARGRGGPRGG
ncbi:hypothetical protein EUX98_g2358 [Antrodiella citrinella]|uniref:UPF3 domain-containing protein n=1 Tax=Antrodiella citrinella TaxID=2447956 RepID=A0A4V3XJ67_9APHY|nr:hypothetical protein EUX98_g2358 [Antrodiella citrinella]